MSKVKFGLKVKIVQFYEKLFDQKKCDQIDWNEFFLLKANPIELEKLIKHNNKIDFNFLIKNCNLVLSNEEEDSKNIFKQLNSLITLYVTFLNHSKIKKIDIENIKELNSILLKKSKDKFKDVDIQKIVLKIYLILICQNDNLNENTFLESIISNQLFDQLFDLILHSDNREELGNLVIIAISLIQNYKLNNNLFIFKLSILENDVSLNAYAQVISSHFLKFNQQFKIYIDSQNVSTMENLFSVFTGLVLNNQQSSSLEKFENVLHQTNSFCVLLGLYDVIHLNRNFLPFLINNSTVSTESNNLLINFLEFCSVIIFCLKENQIQQCLQKKLTISIRLCLVILTCIAEDQYANSMIHDSTSNIFKVKIYQSRLRHRKIKNQEIETRRPIAYSILDLMNEFICTNLRKKKFPVDLYVFCNNIILKIICYQIKIEIRQEYDWNLLWHSLISLLKYLISYEKTDSPKKKCKTHLLLLANNVINLFNLFIIFGDTFLYSPNAYDDLYYELLRMHDVFNNLFQLAAQYSSSKKKDEKEAAIKLLNSLDNIKTIIDHFTAKLNEFKSDINQNLSEQEIREIVKNNYDSLSIKVQDGLDIYENYEPDLEKQSLIKKKVIKKIIDQVKANVLLNYDNLIQDQQTIMDKIFKESLESI